MCGMLFRRSSSLRWPFPFFPYRHELSFMDSGCHPSVSVTLSLSPFYGLCGVFAVVLDVNLLGAYVWCTMLSLSLSFRVWRFPLSCKIFPLDFSSLLLSLLPPLGTCNVSCGQLRVGKRCRLAG